MIIENFLEYFNEDKTENFRHQGVFHGRIGFKDYNIKFSTKNIGKLCLSSGKIVASDPFVFFDEEPFIIEVPKGNYDVILSIAQINDSDERIAYAMLKFDENNPIRWELAKKENKENSSFSEESFFCYGVDSGTGCFMDIESQIILNQMLENEEFDEFLSNELFKNYTPTWNWLNLKLDDLSENNFIAFSSGWGDGEYNSYFGFNEQNQVVCLITDFEVIKNLKE